MVAQVIQPCNSSDKVKPNNKTESTNVLGGKHANWILGEAWCNAIWLKVSQLPGTKSERNSEWGGGKRKLGVCWSSLSTAGRGVMSTERDWNRLFLGLPPVPSLTYNHASSTPFTISAHPSQSTTAGPSCTVAIKTFEFPVSCLTVTDGSWEVGGSLRLSHQREDCRRKWLRWLLSLDFSSVQLWSALRLPQDERWGRELCVMVLACYVSPHHTWFNTGRQ